MRKVIGLQEIGAFRSKLLSQFPDAIYADRFPQSVVQCYICSWMNTGLLFGGESVDRRAVRFENGWNELDSKKRRES